MDVLSYLMARKGGVEGLKYEIVDNLPTVGEDNVIYLVPKSSSKTNNYYDEYMYLNNTWELIGDTEVDLSNYLAKNNTTSFTPSGDYNPATKLYVDKNITKTYLGKTKLYNTQAKALNMNELKKGLYILKHDSSNNKLFLKATYKLSSSASPTEQTLEIDLFENVNPTTGAVNTKVLLNEILLFVDTPVTESTVGTSIGISLGSITVAVKNYEGSSLMNMYKTLRLKSSGFVVESITYEDFQLASKKYVDDQVGAINTVLATLTTPSGGGE